MNPETPHPPVILLLSEKGVDNIFVKAWFEKSRFRTVEAEDIFQALEEISDFTVKKRPDIVILEVTSLLYDLGLIKEIIQTSTDEARTPIFAFPGAGINLNNNEYFEGDLNQLTAELEKIIPQKGAGHYQVVA